MLLRLSKYITIPALVFLLVPVLVFGQSNRSYVYDSIDINIHVNDDTTVKVQESLIYDFVGEYHLGWRSIKLNKVSDISNIKVIDGETDVPLVYSAKRLDKTDPDSWGRYTYFRDNGALNIEWYYNEKDTRVSWLLEYTLHGALSFLKDKDELYWNLFTDYDVPVRKTRAVVHPPNGIENDQGITFAAYTNKATHTEGIQSGETYVVFNFGPAEPQEDVTVAVGWPKGAVDQSVFWWWWVLSNWGYLASGLVVILGLLFSLCYWYFTEKFSKGTGTIIPQYESPLNLLPAEIDVILHERVTKNTWSATVVDLAVRGYLTIEEIPDKKLNIITRVLILLAFIVPLCGFMVFVARNLYIAGETLGLVIILVVSVLILSALGFSISKLKPKHYKITQTDKNVSDLHEYEKQFLVALCLPSGYFSTLELQADPIRGKQLFRSMQKIQEILYDNMDKKGDLYEKPLSLERKRAFFIGIGIIIISPLLWFSSMVLDWWSMILNSLSGYLNSQLIIFTTSLFVTGLVVLITLKFESRLSNTGAKAKEEALGFKLYLKTAERYRLQNLTPDLFEKFLPYAMIFGVEKEWGKAFASISVLPPDWYSNSGVGIASGSALTSNSSGFSASTFSASFSSSFSSAFSSSGGGGSGGGGSAGGGGGGGGGGAS